MPRVTVGTSAVALDTDAYDSGYVLIRNRGDVAVYVDTASSVTTSTGFQIDPGEAVSMTVGGNTANLYAISGSAGQRVDVLKVSV